MAMLNSSIVWAQFVSREAEMQARGPSIIEPQEEGDPYLGEIVRGPKPYKFDKNVKIAILINGEIVSSEDINNRLRAFSFTTQIPLNEETIKMVKERVVQNVIDEKIKIQEAKKEEVIVTNREVEDAIEDFAKSAGATLDELKNDLKKAGVSYESFKEQMASDLSWVRLVRKKTMGEVEPSQKEINRAIENAKSEALKERYLVSEIVISSKNAKNLDDLMYNLRRDPRFGLYAMQFSEVPSSSRGGSLGWITAGKLYPQLDEAIRKMKEGEISKPIKVGDEYYILKLERKHQPDSGNYEIPSAKEMAQIIETSRMEEYASNYLNKLRQKAIIEIKE